ncbi:excalibur calcium-binding domain-containing protein [Streptomyces sp. NPDC002838]|uniref:excalibur calcium-binding domain-containing protein n=1 Tax=Streptomyces sp. NPDC002838 TaxID=3154436 RepID=UPI003327D943
MHLFRKSAAAAVAALALAGLPATAEAHDGTHPFENCTEAYENGYSNIAEGDEHYGDHLDRDGDGVGCDNPPAGFVPAEDEDGSAGSGEATESEASGASGRQDDTDLAATGGDDTTPYLAAGGTAVLLAGGGLLLAARRRRTSR